MQHRDATAELARQIGRARRSLAVERALPLALPAAMAAALWSALWMAGLPQAGAPLAQSLAVIAALIGLAWLCLRGWRSYRPPALAEARARLAVDSGLAPDALEALDDLPAKLDPTGVAFWRREQELARERAAQAKAGPLRPALAHVDRFRLRYAAALLFVGAALYAGPEALPRLARAFTPDPGPLVGDGPLEVEAWAAPAAYTRAPPIALSDRIGQRIETPPSVEVVVRVTGPRGAPRLVFNGRGGQCEARFVRAADGAYEARLALPGPGRLKVVRFIERAAWRIAPAPDAAPRAAFTEAPAVLASGAVTLGWSASDDFGLRAMALRVTPVDAPKGLRRAAPAETPIETPAGDPAQATAQVELDLSQHPYAGLEVEARIVAYDALGQAGESAPMRLRLPEKVFLQPLAQAAIEIRRMILWERRAYERARPARNGATLTWFEPLFGKQVLALRTDDQDPRLERAPEDIRRAARFLDALTMRAEDGYFRDRAVFLGLRSARSELTVAREIDDTNIAADTLWRTALRAEYGGASDARRALEAAQRALADALANGASPERISQLMQALREATNNYLQALVQEAARSGERAQTQEDTEEKTEISERDIDNLMREVERLAREGRTDEAQQLLQQMAGMLQNLDVQLSEGGQSQQGEGGAPNEDGLSQSMDDLSSAMGEQRALNDDTQQRADGQGEGEDGEQDGGGLAARQNAIRESLEGARQSADSAGAPSSEALEGAEGAMRRAEDALRRGDFDSARAAQDDALDSLRRGANELAAEMRRRGEGEGEPGQAGERDPLGRQSTGSGSGDGETNVPTQADRVRAREILDDIRRRAQDPNRPEAERDYLRRLLERFNQS